MGGTEPESADGERALDRVPRTEAEETQLLETRQDAWEYLLFAFALERIGDYVGHSSTYMTDRYRHLLDGHEKEAADILDAYLEQKVRGAHRGAQLAAVPSGAHH